MAPALLGYLLMQPNHRSYSIDTDYVGRSMQNKKLYSSVIDDLTYSNKFDSDQAARSVGAVRNYRNLMALSLGTHKPMFDLRVADGAIGSTQQYVQVCLTEFRELARRILDLLNIGHDQGR
jgi:hypothetical protein